MIIKRYAQLVIVAMLGVCTVCSVAALLFITSLYTKLVGAELQCTPPDGYVEQFHQERTRRSNQVYTRGN